MCCSLPALPAASHKTEMKPKVCEHKTECAGTVGWYTPGPVTLGDSQDECGSSSGRKQSEAQGATWEAGLG